MVAYTDAVVSVLGEELYNECISFFKEFFERKSEYKIILTRRCFSLFKIFEPILKSKGIENKYGIIITDKSMDLYLDIMRKRLDDATDDDDAIVLIIDDIIIYGRTINGMVEKIIDNKLSRLNYVLIRCMLKNQCDSQIKRDFNEVLFPQLLGLKTEWKKVSRKFSTLIKSTPTPNTSYVVSFKKVIKSEEEQSILEYFENNALDNTPEELQKLNVRCYILEIMCKNSVPSISDHIACGWLRIYYYHNTRTLVLSPLVVLNDLNFDEMNCLCNEVAKYLKQIDLHKLKDMILNNEESLYSMRLRLLILLFSQSLLVAFLNNEMGISYNEEMFDVRDIVGYNFERSLISEQCRFLSKIVNTPLLDFSVCLKPSKDISEDVVKYSEKILFKQAMSDNRSAVLGLPSRLDGFSKFGNESAFSSTFMPQILSFIDNGKAALRSFYKGYQFSSKLFPGEQAFRIMEDQFKDVLIYFSYLERYAEINNKDSYELYMCFVKYLLDNKELDESKAQDLMSYLNILEEESQQISDVYTYDSDDFNSSKEDLLKRFLRGNAKK